MDACLKDIAFQESPKKRRYFKLPDGNKSKVTEVEYLTEEQIPTIGHGKITQIHRNRDSSPNFVLDGIRHRMKLSLGMRIILVFCTSFFALITMLVFGDYSS